MRLRRWLVDLTAVSILLVLGLVVSRWVAASTPGPGADAAGLAPLASVGFLGLPGHAVLITAGGHAALIDGGAPGAGGPLVAHLKAEGIEHLDAVFLSSPGDAFVGGLIAVLDSIPVARILDGAWASDCPLYRSFVHLAGRRGVPIEPARRGTTVHLGADVALNVLLPPGDVGEEPPGPLTLRLTAGSERFLFAAAAGPTEQERLLRLTADLRSQVVDVPRTGTLLPGFLDAVSPRVAVVEGPSASPRLAASGAAVLDTGRLGTVIVATDGHGLIVRFGSPSVAPGPQPVVSCGGAR